MGRVLLVLLASCASVATPSDLRLELDRPPAVVRPLQAVGVEAPGPGTVSVLDGKGREYFRAPARGRVTFAAGGAAGPQTVRLLDAAGRAVESVGFRLEALTAIEDAGGRMKDLLRLGRKTLERPNDSGTPTGVGTLEWRGQTYDYFVPWLRDHVHTLKGMKYFERRGASFIDFFRETQREDGMIWDFFTRGEEPSFYETAYGPLGYARRYDAVEMVRMPVEADVEYLFVEGVYFAWKATADDAWMARQLDAAIRAMDYSFTDRTRFSTKYGLVKRGYTIDTWDFLLRTYQKIRASLPAGSPGEWYGIYPPFAKGFSDHSEAWQYVNGGVSPIFAGELARGAFAHGFETYGADVLRRVLDLTKSSGDQISFAYTGAYPPVPEPRFTPKDLARLANMDLGGEGAPGVPRWMAAEPDDHLGRLPTGRQTLAGVPFLVADPATNGRRGAIAVSRRPGFPERVEVPVGAKVGSIYVLHSVGNAGNTKLAGAITFVYEDGTDATQYVVQDRNVSGWWYPSLDGSWPEGYAQPRRPPLVKLAWRGRSDVCPNVGIYWYGLENPHPDRTVRAVAFTSTQDGAIYAIAGAAAAAAVTDDAGGTVAFTTSRVESSTYADFTVGQPAPRTVRVRY